MHLKSAQAILFIQERIVFLTDLSPALLLLLKDKLGPLENKAVATILNRFALAYIYIGQASPSPGLAACTLRQKPGGVSLFFFICSLWFDLYAKRDIFIIVHSKLGFFIAHESCFPKLDYLYSTLIAVYFRS